MPNLLPMIVAPSFFFVVGLIAVINDEFPSRGLYRMRGMRARVMGILWILPGIAAWSALVINREFLSAPLLSMQTANSIGQVTQVLMFIALVATPVLQLTDPTIRQRIFRRRQKSDTMSISEAARYLKLREVEIQHLIDTRRLEAVEIGGDFRIPKKSIDQLKR